MSEHDEKGEERVEDLDVPESESEDVKGGLLLPAVDQLSNKVSQKFGKVELGNKINPGGGRLGGGGL